MDVYLTEAELDVTQLIAETEDVGAGALAIFVGTVRVENEGREVSGVTYEAQPELATKELRAIEHETLDQFAVSRCRIVHRIGLVSLGEASVAIVVRSAHRDASFVGLRYAIEQLKARVPIWKLEHYVDGEAVYLDGKSIAVSAEDGA